AHAEVNDRRIGRLGPRSDEVFADQALDQGLELLLGIKVDDHRAAGGTVRLPHGDAGAERPLESLLERSEEGISWTIGFMALGISDPPADGFFGLADRPALGDHNVEHRDLVGRIGEAEQGAGMAFRDPTLLKRRLDRLGRTEEAKGIRHANPRTADALGY